LSSSDCLCFTVSDLDTAAGTPVGANGVDEAVWHREKGSFENFGHLLHLELMLRFWEYFCRT
jgi:hypothetical protein